MLLETLHKESSDRTGKDPIKSRRGKGRALTISKCWTDGGFSTRGTQSTFGNITSRKRDNDFPLFHNYLISLLLVFYFFR